MKSTHSKIKIKYAWLFNYLIIIIIVTGISFSLNGETNTNYKDSEEKRFEQYCIGLKYLEINNALSTSEKAAYYKQLKKITGFSEKEAKIYIDRYKENPQEWDKILMRLIKYLEEINAEKENVMKKKR